MLPLVHPVAIDKNLVQVEEILLRVWDAANAHKLRHDWLLSKICAVFRPYGVIGEHGVPFLPVFRDLHLDWRLPPAIAAGVCYENAPNATFAREDDRRPRLPLLVGVEGVSAQGKCVKPKRIRGGDIPLACG